MTVQTDKLRKIRERLANLPNKNDTTYEVAFEIVRDLDELLIHDDVLACRACELHQQCKSRVPGAGSMLSDIMFVGEASGEQEDEQGIPFVGPAGQMLNKVIEATGWKRDDIYITNVIKCHPPGNRNPTQAEVVACREHLKKEIELVKPKVVVCWGSVAANTLIHPDFKITQEQGHWFEHEGIRYIAAFHPSYLLRLGDGTEAQNRAKWTVWEAMQKVKAYQNSGFKDILKQGESR